MQELLPEQENWVLNGDVAPLSAFLEEIQSLGATHAENFLCIYNDQLFYSAPQRITAATG